MENETEKNGKSNGSWASMVVFIGPLFRYHVRLGWVRKTQVTARQYPIVFHLLVQIRENLCFVLLQMAPVFQAWDPCSLFGVERAGSLLLAL